MSKKILTTLLSIILLLAIVVPTIASPYYADENTNSGVVPEDASSSYIDGGAVPYGAPVPYAEEIFYFSKEDFDENTTLAWGNTADVSAPSGATDSHADFTMTVSSVPTPDDYYYKNLRIRAYLTPSRAGIINWSATAGTNIGYEVGGQPFTVQAVNNAAEGYIEYAVGDLFNGAYQLAGRIAPVFHNNATFTGDTIILKLEAWYEDIDGVLKKIEYTYATPADNKETKKHIATSSIAWQATAAAVPAGTTAGSPKTLVYETQTDTTGYKFTFTAKDTNTTNKGDLTADYINFSGEVVLPSGVTMADISKAGLKLNGQPLGYYGAAIENLEFKLEGGKVVYSFKYNPDNGNPPTTNTPTSAVELSLNEIQIAGLADKSFELKYTGKATATGVDGTSVSETGDKTATVYVKRPGLPESIDKELLDSMEIEKNVVAFDSFGLENGFVNGPKCDNDFENDDSIFYDITSFGWKAGYSVKDLIIWDTFATSYLVADSIRVGSYEDIGGTAIGAKAVHIVVGGSTYTYVFGTPKPNNETITIAEILANAKTNGGTGTLLPSSVVAKHITAMGVGFGDVDAGFKAVDNTTYIRFGFIVNPDDLFVPVAEVGRVMTNSAKLSFCYTVSPHAQQQYNQEKANTQAYVAQNDEGVLTIKKTVSKTNNVTYGDVLTYTITISNTSEASKKVKVGTVTDTITAGMSHLVFVKVDSIKLAGANMDLTATQINTTDLSTSNNGAGILTWDFKDSLAKDYVLYGQKSIVIVYRYRVKTYVEALGATIPTPIRNSVTLGGKTGTTSSGTLSIGPRPIIFYNIDATSGGVAMPEFDPMTGEKKIDYTMTIQNKQNVKDGSVNLSKLTFDIAMPNGFIPLKSNGTEAPDATTLTISRSGRALALTSSVASSSATQVVVEYKIGSATFCTVTYTKETANGVDRWKFNIAFVENTTTTILNARTADDTTSLITDDEAFTINWSANTPTNTAAFGTSVAYAFFNSTATLTELKGVKAGVNTAFTPIATAASISKTVYIVDTVDFTANTAPKVTGIISGTNRVLTLPIAGKCGTVNNIFMTAVVRRGSGYPNKYNDGTTHNSIAANARLYVGQKADITVTIKNQAGRTFNPQDNTMFVHLPKGLTATVDSIMTVTRSNNYIYGATIYTGNTQTLNGTVQAKVVAITQLDTSPGVTADNSASLVKIEFQQNLDLTSFFGPPNVEISGSLVKWNKTATATFKLTTKVEESFVPAGRMATTAATDITAILPFNSTGAGVDTNKDLADNTYIEGKKPASDSSFANPGLGVTGYDRANKVKTSASAYRMMHVVNLESKFIGSADHLTHDSQVTWELLLKHTSTNEAFTAGGYVVFTVPKYMQVTSVTASGDVFSVVNTNASQTEEYTGSPVDTTTDYPFDLSGVNYNPELETLYVYTNILKWRQNTTPTITVKAKIVILDFEDIKYYGDRFFNAYFMPTKLDQAQVFTSATNLSNAVVSQDTTKCSIVDDTKRDAPHIFKGLPLSVKTSYGSDLALSIYAQAKGSVWGGLGATVYTQLDVAGENKTARSDAKAVGRKVQEVALGEEIVYSFSVQNSSMATGSSGKAFTYDDMVLINRLPGVGDLGVVNPRPNWARFSAFKPEFDLDVNGDPQILVWDYDLADPNYKTDPESCKVAYAGSWEAVYTDNLDATTNAFDTDDWTYINTGGMGWSTSLSDYSKATAIKINIEKIDSQHKLVVEIKMRVPEVIDFTEYINARLTANPTDYAIKQEDFLAANSFGVAMSLNGNVTPPGMRYPAADTNFVSLSVKDPKNAWTGIDNIVKNCLDEDITGEFAKNNGFTLTLKDKWRNTAPVEIVFTFDAATQKYVTLTPGSWALGQYEIVEAKFNGNNSTTLNGLFDVILKHQGDDIDDDTQGDPTLAGVTTTINSYIMRKVTTGIPVDELTFMHRQKEATLKVDTTLSPPTISIGGFTPGDTDNQNYVLQYPAAPGRTGSGGTFANPQTEDMQNSIVDFKRLTWGTDEEYTITFDLPYGWKPDRMVHPDYVKIEEDEVAGYSRFMLKFKLSTPVIRSNGTVNLAHLFSIQSVMQSGAINILKSWNGYTRPGANSITEFHVIADGYGIDIGEKFEYVAGLTGAEAKMQNGPTNHIASYMLASLKKGFYELYEVCYGYEPGRLNEGRWVYWTTVERTLNGKVVEAGVYKYVGDDGEEARIYVEDEQTWLTGCYNYRYEKPEEPVVPPKSYYYNSSSEDSSVSSSSMPEEYSSSSEPPIIPIVDPPVAGESWSLVNLIMSIVAAAISLFLFFAFFKKKEQDDGEYDEQGEKTGNAPLVVFMRILAIILGVSVGILFLILEDLRTPMTIINQWTVLLGIIFAVHLIVTTVYTIVKKREEQAVENPYAEEADTDTDSIYIG